MSNKENRVQELERRIAPRRFHPVERKPGQSMDETIDEYVAAHEVGENDLIIYFTNR